MQDVKHIIENPEKFIEGAKNKKADVDIKKLVQLYEKRNKAMKDLESLRARQNEVSKEIMSAKNKDALLEEMKKAKEEIKNLQPQIEEFEKEIDEIAIKIPNPTLKSTPHGKDETESVVVKTYGKKPKFDFQPLDHVALGKSLDIIDIERGARASGARFYYLKGAAALLEFALIQYVINKLVQKGFTPVIPPVLVKEEAMYATGFFPADRNEIYSVNPGEDNLFLVGTSEVPLTMLHATEILEEPKLPLRYAGFSTCFRREAGSYGKDTTGIIRVHQFDKIEMFSFCHPEKSEEEHELIRETQEEIMQELEFHYQVVNICDGDLGHPAAKKYDIEVWIPTQEKFRELTSCSNCTDFQARRSKIKYKTAEGKNEYLHTLNGTATAIGRTLVAIIENYQTAEGEIIIPKVLRPYMGGKERITKK
ncbi:MAG: serine--tRNA ligase [Candidatus Gracilibacteria bacterium]|jgi:seryl-tRNA synthetase